MPNDEARDERDPASANRAMGALREVIRSFNVATKKLERQFGLSGAQLEALEILKENPGLSPSDLALHSSTDQSTASVVAGRLADSGLVNRRQHDGDRRRALLTLTPSGEALLDKAPPSVSARLRDAFMRMARDERITLTQLFERWLSLAGLKRAA